MKSRLLGGRVRGREQEEHRRETQSCTHDCLQSLMRKARAPRLYCAPMPSHSRRSFIKTTVAAAGAAVLPFASAGAQPARKYVRWNVLDPRAATSLASYKRAIREMLALPPALAARDRTPDWAAIREGLRVTGHFLARDLLIDHYSRILAARERLVERLKRMEG